MLKQEKAAGSETLRGGVTPPGKAGRRGDGGRLQAVTGDLHFFATGSCLRCRKNDFSEIYGVGMMLHIMRYYFAPFIRFEIIKSTASRVFFLRSGALLYDYFGCCKSCYTDMVY